MLSEFRSKRGDERRPVANAQRVSSQLLVFVYHHKLNYLSGDKNHIFSAALDIPTNTSLIARALPGCTRIKTRVKKIKILSNFPSSLPATPPSPSLCHSLILPCIHAPYFSRSLLLPFLFPLSPVGRFKRMDSFCLLAVLKTVILSETYF